MKKYKFTFKPIIIEAESEDKAWEIFDWELERKGQCDFMEEIE